MTGKTADLSFRRISRREFLRHGGTAAAGVAAAALAGMPAGEEGGGTQPPGPPPRTLPPAIGADDYRARLAAVRDAMSALAVDALLLPAGSDMEYLTGLELRRRERLVAFMVHASGPSIIFCPDFDKEIVDAGPVPIEQVQTWDADQDPMKMLKKHIKRSGLSKKKIAVGGRLWYDEFADIDADLPKLNFISATTILGGLREHKSPAEMALIRGASRLTEKAIDRCWSDAKEGMSEEDLAAAIAARIGDAGVQAEGVVRFGGRTAAPHSARNKRPLAAGDVVVVDFMARLHGYWGGVVRTAVFGRVMGRMRLIQDQLVVARQEMIKFIKPERSCSSVTQHARSSVRSPAFNDLVGPHVGHGIGLDRHEAPFLRVDNYEPISAGDVFMMDLGIFTRGQYAIRTADPLEVTQSGSRFLTSPASTLIAL
ncbi:MAG: M24 family metallopeptidase [Acidobacteriota bacterium]